MRPARRLCGVPCLCDHPHLCRQSSPRASPRAQTFLSVFFYSQANSISHPASGFCRCPFPQAGRVYSPLTLQGFWLCSGSQSITQL